MLHVVKCRGHVCHTGHEKLSIMVTLFSETAIKAPKKGQESS